MTQRNLSVKQKQTHRHKNTRMVTKGEAGREKEELWIDRHTAHI